MNDFYSINDMVDRAINEFQLDSSESAMTNYKMMFRRNLSDLKATNIFGTLEPDDVNVVLDKTTRNATKRYSKEIVDYLFYSPKVYNYFIKNSNSDAIKERGSYEKLMEDIRSRRQEAIYYATNHEPFDDARPFLSHNELMKYKNNMMLEALFNVFYTEFDTDKLREDLELAMTSDEFNVTPALLDAEYRFNHPEGNYFTRKKK